MSSDAIFTVCGEIFVRRCQVLGAVRFELFLSVLHLSEGHHGW